MDKRENSAQDSETMPFKNEKIPVSEGLEAFKMFTESYPGYAFCPYIADKDAQQWDISTSRIYMNQVLPQFLYVPVNIARDDQDELAQLLEFAETQPNIPAVNITQPHKSSPVLREMFFHDKNAANNIDTLIRNPEGQLEPFDLNAPAFVGWFNDEVGSFKDRSVILIGVGGVGEPMAKHISDQHPSDLILIDPVDKQELVRGLSSQTHASYCKSITELGSLTEGAVVINAAGKEGVSDNSQLIRLLEENANSQGVFVDIRPHLEIDIVEQAKELGWSAYTGHGMNARNDYILLEGIARNIGVKTPQFKVFEQLVANAS